MKKLVSILFLFVLASCSKDFLNLTPTNALSVENFYRNEDEAENAVNAIYARVRSGLARFIEMTEVRSDNTTTQYNYSVRPGVQLEWEAVDEFRDDAFSVRNDYWSVSFPIIYNINLFLERLENAAFTTSGMKERLQAEARFLRAYLYFNLVRFYGDVTLLDKTISVNDAYQTGRTPAAEVYAFLMDDAQFAASTLPASYTGNDVGRATKGAALMLLGEANMTLKKYPEAEALLRQVAQLGYNLRPNYQECFDPAYKNNSESIFEFQFSDVIGGQHNSFVLGWVPFGTPAWQTITGFPTGGNINVVNQPTRDVIESYEPDDLRKDISVREFYLVNGDPVYIPYINKWIYPSATVDRNDCNFQVYRYADAMLMLAEAINEVSGPTGEAVGLMNQVRARADLLPKSPGSKEEFRLDLEQERRAELAFEGHRWFDLLRTGRAKVVMTAHGADEMANPTYDRPPYFENSFIIGDHKLLYPIPGVEVNKYPAVLTQNSGY